MASKVIALAMLSAGLVLAACATSPRRSTVPETLRGPALASLPAQNLEPGECGMFLWSFQTPHNLIFFRKAGESTAISVLTGVEVPLKVTSESGKVFGQFMTETIYQTAKGEPVRIVIVPGELIQDGQRTQSAEIRFQTREGWETIIPASGLSACIPANAPAG